MTDNQLYDFFKTRSNSFEEMPSDALWNKINQNINREIPQISKKFISAKTVLLLIFAVISTTLLVLFFSNNKPEIQKPVEKKEIITNKKSILIESKMDDVTREIPVRNSDTVKKKRFQKHFKILSTKNSVAAPEPVSLISPKAETPEVAKQNVSDSLKFKPQIIGNRYLYESKEELTDEEFDLFVKKVLKENELKYGRLIVIKSKGHIPFRQFMKKPLKSLEITSSTAKLKPESVIYKGILVPKDSIIKYKNDTLILKETLHKNK